jgi:hypothetical protein
VDIDSVTSSNFLFYGGKKNRVEFTIARVINFVAFGLVNLL